MTWNRQRNQKWTGDLFPDEWLWHQQSLFGSASRGAPAAAELLDGARVLNECPIIMNPDSGAYSEWLGYGGGEVSTAKRSGGRLELPVGIPRTCCYRFRRLPLDSVPADATDTAGEGSQRRVPQQDSPRRPPPRGASTSGGDMEDPFDLSPLPLPAQPPGVGGSGVEALVAGVVVQVWAILDGTDQCACGSVGVPLAVPNEVGSCGAFQAYERWQPVKRAMEAQAKTFEQGDEQLSPLYFAPGGGSGDRRFLKRRLAQLDLQHITEKRVKKGDEDDAR